ncbi:MAG: hypothetical protein ACREOS_00535, partial [Candidatus Dormibacteraceae bacterium]
MAQAVAAPVPFPDAVDERISVASQWQLTWWRFRKHALAMIGAVVII